MLIYLDVHGLFQALFVVFDKALIKWEESLTAGASEKMFVFFGRIIVRVMFPRE